MSDARDYKPSAYDLVQILLEIPSKAGTSGAFDLEAMAARVEQDRARLLDEAAERMCHKADTMGIEEGDIIGLLAAAVRGEA